MTSANVIGFPENDTRMTDALAANGFAASPVRSASDLHPGAAVFLSGDMDGWLDTLRETRALYPRTFLVVVTRIPDAGKWLDALEAGADDYGSLPLDSKQMQWIVRSFMGRQAASS